MAVSRDCRLVAATLLACAAHIYDAKTGDLLKMTKSSGDLLDGVDFSMDGQLLFYGSMDKTVNIWNYNKPVPTLKTIGGHTVVAKPHGVSLE